MESKAITGKNTHTNIFPALKILIAMTKPSIIRLAFSLEWYCNLLVAVK